jgi:hypothetical protein
MSLALHIKDNDSISATPPSTIMFMRRVKIEKLNEKSTYN